MSRPFPFQLRIPAFAAPMFLVSGPELVIAACKAGTIGAFPTPNCRTSEELDDWMSEITDALASAQSANPTHPVAPWAANLVTHSTNTRLPADLKLVAKHKPPIVITALGSPRPAVELVHDYGGYVFADVVDIKLARKAVDAGVDGLACISAGAGGHTGHLSPLAFVSAVREFFDGWIVVGGGIADGAGIAGAVASGGDLVYIGTRFLATYESLASAPYKQMVVDCGPDDLLISSAVTGTPASWLKPSLKAAGIPTDGSAEHSKRNYSSDDSSHRRWKDVWAAGQGLQKITSIEWVAAVVARLEREYVAASERFLSLAPCKGPRT